MSKAISTSVPDLESYKKVLGELQASLITKQKVIENWFHAQWQLTPAPFYGSVDLRNAGYKLAPIDMNLFPAGFNNLNKEFMATTAEAAKAAMQQVMPSAKHVLIIPENHTRNLFYWDNVQTLKQILQTAGFKVSIGSLLSETPASVTRVQNTLQVAGETPDVIVLNNDLSAGIPDILLDLLQPIVPPPELGWSRRLKSTHFQHYAEISQEFAALTGIDAWQIAPLFRYCAEVDFMRRAGGTCLIKNATDLFVAIQKEFKARHITSDPFIVVKADAGTYGMGVMTVRSVEELFSLNRKQRTSMAKTKSGQAVTQVILQEGVYSYETVGTMAAVAEPVVYLFGKQVIGGFYRVHKERGVDENLNAPGMHFEPLPFAKPCCLSSAKEGNYFYLYGLIARLSMLAAARELREQEK